MKFFKSIKFRLTMWNVLVIVILLVSFGATAYLLLYNTLHKNLDQALQTAAAGFGNSPDFGQERLDFGKRSDEMILIYDSATNLISNTAPDVGFANIDVLVKQALLGRSSFLTTETSDGQEVRLYAAPLITEQDSRVAIVVGRSTADITDMMNSFIRILGISSGVIVLLSGVGGIFLANRALKPVDRITRQAREMGEKSLNQRIAVAGGDELGRLASTLNDMLGRLEAAFERQRQFTADASHELRTPLAVIRAESTLALSKERPESDYQKSLGLVAQEASQMAGMIEKLLVLARTESNKEPLQMEEINLKVALLELNADLEPLALEKDIKLEPSSLVEAIVMADRIKLRQLMLSLFDNALKYSPPGSIIWSNIKLSGKNAVLNITDNGPGIAAEHLPHIFERFYRVDKARSRSEGGTGIGLSIAKIIAEAHGGSIEVKSQVGLGSTFSVKLPLFGIRQPPGFDSSKEPESRIKTAS